ncbi:hypothetical protein L6452_19373 [Arctium lappa]|uniref:Uncharacterized protein n=1 Tax=Arctium lappa TaxID=4217 RepID=A0ACB9B7P2_ARCLA|nr:hypothetical protein L6452_19373 [Arctium lappa]
MHMCSSMFISFDVNIGLTNFNRIYFDSCVVPDNNFVRLTGEGTDRVAKSDVKGYVNNNQKCDSGKAGEGTYTVAKSYVKGYVNNNQNGDSGKVSGKKKGPVDQDLLINQPFRCLLSQV